VGLLNTIGQRGGSRPAGAIRNGRSFRSSILDKRQTRRKKGCAFASKKELKYANKLVDRPPASKSSNPYTGNDFAVRQQTSESKEGKKMGGAPGAEDARDSETLWGVLLINSFNIQELIAKRTQTSLAVLHSLRQKEK